MDRERMIELAEEVQFAFEQACERGYITEYSSKKEVLDNSYEIMEFSELGDTGELDELSDEEWAFIEKMLVEQLR